MSNIVKLLIFENNYNSENLYAIKSLVKEIGERLSHEFKELESVEISDEDVIFNWEDSLVDDYNNLQEIREEFFSLFMNEARQQHPELF